MLKINRNIFWSNLFINYLSYRSIKYACISPGSRSTPLTISVAQNKSITSFPIIDERSSVFFALGLSKISNIPTLVITTSGTAVAELYPAIIEAFQSRVPLIICTADRPSKLRYTGANQTINQNNIFKNHIYFSADIPSFKVNQPNIKKFLIIINYALDICLFKNKGPVHLNFQFDKPFEPDSYTDVIDAELINFAKNYSELLLNNNSINPAINLLELNKITAINLITIGIDNFKGKFTILLNKVSKKYNIPIFADIGSNLRNNAVKLKNIIYNYDSLIRSNLLKNIFQPETILHFGRSLTSIELEEFLKTSKSKRFIVNEFGDRFDSTKKGIIIKSEPVRLLENLLNLKLIKNSEHTLNKLIQLDFLVEKSKIKIFKKSFSEVEIINQIFDLLPDKSSVLVGNSLPIRDLDFFKSKLKKKIKIFTNRGASGIDGLISTAAGICKLNKNNTYLILGDLSFYYDLNALLILKHFNIPLKIIIINNNGGRIFDYLPISKFEGIFEKYFTTPVNLNFKRISNAFEIDFFSANTLKKLIYCLNLMNKSQSSVILEIKVNPFFTRKLKTKFREDINLLMMKNSG